jgi:hypothetical protein
MREQALPDGPKIVKVKAEFADIAEAHPLSLLIILGKVYPGHPIGINLGRIYYCRH